MEHLCVPYHSHLVKGTRQHCEWRLHFFSAKVLIKNHGKGIAKRLQFLVKTIEQLIHPNNLSNAAQ